MAQQIAPLYGTLNEAELEALASILQYRAVRRNEILVNDGQVCRYMVYVHSGLLRQFYFKKGREITEHFTCEGQIAYCIESIFRNKPTSLLMKALEDGELILIPYAHLVEQGRRYSGLAEWLRCFLENNLILHQVKADSWRFESVQERYARFLREYPTVAHRASVNDIASYLLMTPETLSRVRSQGHKRSDLRR